MLDDDLSAAPWVPIGSNNTIGWNIGDLASENDISNGLSIDVDRVRSGGHSGDVRAAVFGRVLSVILLFLSLPRAVVDEAPFGLDAIRSGSFETKFGPGCDVVEPYACLDFWWMISLAAGVFNLA